MLLLLLLKLLVAALLDAFEGGYDALGVAAAVCAVVAEAAVFPAIPVMNFISIVDKKNKK
jgi:hypothetical protein